MCHSDYDYYEYYDYYDYYEDENSTEWDYETDNATGWDEEWIPWNLLSSDHNETNVTHQVFGDYRIGNWIYIVFPPIILLFGMVGNILSVIVLGFSRGNMSRGTMPIYLITLAIADTTLLIVGLLRLWIIAVFHSDIRTKSSLACKTLTFLTHALIYFSSWVIVAITTERTIVIIFPHGWKCTRKKAKLTLMFLGVFMCGISAHILYGYTLMEDSCRFNYSLDYDTFYMHAWLWVNLIIQSIAPSTVLIAANAAIIWKIKKNNRNLSEFVSKTRGHGKGTDSSSSEPTRLLIVLSITYLITTLPKCISMILRDYLEPFTDCVTEEKFMIALDITTMLMYCNNAVNFYLYCLSGPAFRRQLLQLMHSCASRGSRYRVPDGSQATSPKPRTQVCVVEFQQTK